MKRILIIIGVLAILAAGGYTIYTRRVASGSALQPDEQSYTVVRTDLRESLTLSGKVEAEEKVTMNFPISGKLTWVGVKESDFVTRHQGIASMDARELQKRLESSLNSYMITRWDFEQTKSDNKSAPFAEGEVGERLRRIIDKAQFSLNNSVITVELAALAKEYAYLSSPIEGVVTRVGAGYAGMNITPATSYEIINPSTIYFSASADQTEVPQLRVGQSAYITLDPYADEKMLATVKTVSFTPRVGESGTVYEVKMAFVAENPSLKYRVGMTGDAEFVTRERSQVLTVPLQYIKTEKSKKYVTRIADGKREKVEVKLGEDGNTEVEVLSGLSENDVIVETK